MLRQHWPTFLSISLALLLGAPLLLQLDGFTQHSSSPVAPPPLDEKDIYQFSKGDASFLKTFSIKSLPKTPLSAKRQYLDDPNAVNLGHQLFFDERLSGDGTVSCSTCHQPDLYFTDGLKVSVGLSKTRRNSPTVVGTFYSPWLTWDGRKDSQWSQALAAMENPLEHGGARTDYVRLVTTKYGELYQSVFGELPNFKDFNRFPKLATPSGDARSRQLWADMSEVDRQSVNRAFTNIGKVLMAYQRQLVPGVSRFDQFVDVLEKDVSDVERLKSILSMDEVAGMKLFMGKGNCSSCHSGPLFTNFEFHNVGVPQPNRLWVDLGRAMGVLQLKVDEFNCFSLFSDRQANECDELTFVKSQGGELVGAFKTPTLRNISQTAPYMQSGQFDTLDEVLAHYNEPQAPMFHPDQHPFEPHSDLTALGLHAHELKYIKAFLNTLTGPIDAPNHLLSEPPTVHSSIQPSASPNQQAGL